jgi:hypothetical protein
MGEPDATKRRAALRSLAISLKAGMSHCDRLTQLLEKAADQVDGLTDPARTMLDDLELVLIGTGLTERGKGSYFAGAHLGASGFKCDLQDKSDQSAHALAGIVIGYRHGYLGGWGAMWLEEEAADDRLYEATLPLGRRLTDSNYKKLAAEVKTAVCGPGCSP